MVKSCDTVKEIRRISAVCGLGVATLAGAGASLIIGKVAVLPFATGIGAACLLRMMWNTVAAKKSH